MSSINTKVIRRKISGVGARNEQSRADLPRVSLHGYPKISPSDVNIVQIALILKSIGAKLKFHAEALQENGKNYDAQECRSPRVARTNVRIELRLEKMHRGYSARRDHRNVAK